MIAKPEQIDWYERRNELKEGMVFYYYEGGLVKLDRRVPCDGAQWYVATWYNGHWSYDDSIIEPSELCGQPVVDPIAA